MLYAIKIGPLETGDGPCHAYVGVRDDGFLARPRIGRSDKQALRELAADSDPGEKLLCEKRLSAGTLRALACVTPQHRQARIALEGGDHQMTVSVTAPIPTS